MKPIHPHDPSFPVIAPPRRLAAVMALLVMGSAGGETLAYWRFEGDGVISASTGIQVEDSNGRTTTSTATGIRAVDSSGNGNTIWAWEHAWAGHTYEPGVPWSVVPQTGSANNYCVANSGDFPALFTWSSQSSPGGVNLDTWTSSTWTIEASCYTTALGNYRTVVGREGNGVETANAAAAPIYFQMLNNNRFRIMYVDATGVAREAVDSTAMVANQWYHFAATCDGATLKLYKKIGVAGNYNLAASTDVSGSTNPALVAPGNDANGTPWGWTVARGRYGTSDFPADDHGDRWLGGIDEVRISNVALDPSQFLGQQSATPDDLDGDGMSNTWETANALDPNSDVGDDGAEGDPDLDLAINLLEYQNSTNPNLATSYPDTDDDGLNDGWEDFYFDNLAQLGGGDPDGDFSTNNAEHIGGTDPSFGGNFPDTDNSGAGDGISDGWEIYYFDNIAACDPAVDFDGDFFSNDLEFAARTHPKNQESSPDTDNFTGDGLADGWEVKYFGQPGDTLESAIARQSGTDDFDADGYSNAAEFSLHTNPDDADSVPGPVAWWRYEEATTGPVSAGNGGEAEFNNVVLDSSASGNHMRTYNGMTAPAYSTDVPFATVPLGGEINTASLYFDGAQDGTWLDLVYTDQGAPVRSMTFTGWTIEASFKMDSATGYQVVFAKDGNPLGGQPPFSLKFRDPDKKFEVGIVDGAGVARYASSLGTLSAGEWYSVAATANATTLSLWLKGPGDSAYVLQETTEISGAFFNTFAGLNDAWAAGRGRWNGGETDFFKGYIDEVRISAAALGSDKFLASSAIVDTDDDGMDDNWELTHFTDPLLPETAEGDFDKDGTSNIAEYLLGLDPTSGSSRFAVSESGGLLTWSAAPGLAFTVQRSTTLAGWDDLDTVIATGTTASWTDPVPPAGEAFYRVVLDTD